MAGDLPPSSRITGVRFSAADAITFLPVAPDPVKMMRVEGEFGELDTNAARLFKEYKLVFGKYFGESSRSSRVSERLFSDILTMTRLPAANAVAICDTDKKTGKFQGIMSPRRPVVEALLYCSRRGTSESMDAFSSIHFLDF